jgi:hypothetical protein
VVRPRRVQGDEKDIEIAALLDFNLRSEGRKEKYEGKNNDQIFFHSGSMPHDYRISFPETKALGDSQQHFLFGDQRPLERPLLPVPISGRR